MGMRQTFQSQMLLLEKVKSLCPICNAIVDGEIIKENDGIYLVKRCCGESFKVLKERDLKLYELVKKYSIKNENDGVISLDNLPEMVDELSSFTIHLTERCNANCKVCVTDLGRERRWEEFWNIKRLKAFLNLIKGKRKLIILSGGEPTVREDLPTIIKAIVESGNIPYLFTNGLKLTDYQYVKELKKAGLKLIHFSLDSLRSERNSKLRGLDTRTKMEALKNIKKCGMKVYLSTTIIDGFNDDEIGSLINFTAANSDFISGIIFRPFVPQGRVKIEMSKILTLSDLIKLAERQTNGLINKDYLLEFRRFRFNIYNSTQKLFGKELVKSMDFSYFLDCILEVKKSVSGRRYENIKLKPLIAHEKLMKINEVLENSGATKLKTIFSLLKLIDTKLANLMLLAFRARFNFSQILESSFSFSNMIRITFSELSTNINVDLTEKFASYAVDSSFNRVPKLLAGYISPT